MEEGIRVPFAYKKGFQEEACPQDWIRQDVVLTEKVTNEWDGLFCP